MFFCPDNYEEFLKETQEWVRNVELKYIDHITKSYPSFCDFFNLPKDFNEDELDKAYRSFRLKYHPDRPNGDKEKFMRALEIYNELKAYYKYHRGRLNL